MGMEAEIFASNPEDLLEQGSALARIRGMLPTLVASEAQVAKWILKHAGEVVYLSMARVAEICGVSDTTVLRFCRSVGFHGYTDLKISLARDLASPTQMIHADVIKDDMPHVVARKVFSANIQALVDTLEILDGEALQRAVTLLASARRILIIGVGTSIPIVQEMDHRLFRLGLDCCAETDSYLQLMRAALLGLEDVVVAISQSGASVDPVLTLQEAKRRGTKTICITGNEKSPLTEYADIVLISVSTEVSSEAMASRIAQASIVDALYVSLSLLDINRTMRNERRIWDAIIPKSI
jgi:RpiR family carbohydrate utilization transcriptional regulator